MAVPTWDKFMIPALQVLSDGSIRRRREVIRRSADILGISEADREENLQSGQARYINRGSWAVSYLSKANALESPQRAHWMITDYGRQLLEKFPHGMTEEDLRKEVGYSYAPSTFEALEMAEQHSSAPEVS